MKTEYRLYVAILVAAAVFGGYYFISKENDKEFASRAPDAAGADMPSFGLPEADVGAVTKVHIKNGDKSDVTLEKKGDTWMVTAPVSATANQKNMEQLLDNLKTLTAKEVIDSTGGTYEQYELTDEKAVHVEVFKGADKALDLYFGKTGTRGQMGRVAGKDGVYTVDKYSSFLYTREVKNWRETELLKFEPANVIQASVENKNGLFSFSKNGEEWSGSFQARGDDGSLKKAKGEWAELDKKKINDMLLAFKNLRAQDFAAEGDDLGLDAPTENGGVVKIVLKDGAASHTIKVGKVQKGENRFAVVDKSDTNVVISSWSADWAVAEREKFEATPAPEGAEEGGDDMPDLGELEGMLGGGAPPAGKPADKKPADKKPADKPKAPPPAAPPAAPPAGAP